MVTTTASLGSSRIVTESSSRFVTAAREPDRATAKGRRPTETSETTVPAASATRETLSEVELATAAQEPSALRARSRGERSGPAGAWLARRTPARKRAFIAKRGGRLSPPAPLILRLCL